MIKFCENCKKEKEIKQYSFIDGNTKWEMDWCECCFKNWKGKQKYIAKLFSKILLDELPWYKRYYKYLKSFINNHFAIIIASLLNVLFQIAWASGFEGPCIGLIGFWLFLIFYEKPNRDEFHWSSYGKK